MRPLPLLLALAGAAILAIVAIPASASAPRAGAAASATVKLRNYHISFSKRTFKVPRRGGTIKLSIKNTARRTKHSLAVNGKVSRKLKGGGSQSNFKVKLKPRRKAYTVICPIDNHAGKGMTTKIRVKKR